jgi:hypothetical protein
MIVNQVASEDHRVEKQARGARSTSILVALGVATTLALTGAAYADPHQQPQTWYVNGAAAAGGDGSSSSPFNTLLVVHLLAGPGDTIIIQPSTVTLNGGISLLPGQKLIGGGPPVVQLNAPLIPNGPQVVGSSGLSAAPTITNTTNYLSGDAVDMADNTVVENLVIKGTLRGGIYAQDAHNIQIVGNDISAINSSITPGFRVQPFCLEQYAAGVANCSSGLQDGFAAIQVDGLGGQSNVLVKNNYIHNGTCNDGINIRAMNVADVTANVDGNFVTSLVQCTGLNALNNIGTQVLGQGRLNVTIANNTEANSGSPGADAEGLFVNPAEAGTLIENVENNVYMNGIGGASTNGLEFILGNGSPQAQVTVSNSYFANNPGDMLEMFNRGARGSQSMLILNNVTVQNTTISNGLPTYGDPPGTARSPDNTGECLGIGSVGANDVTILQMNNSSFTGCGNNGIEVTNNHAASDNGTAGPDTVILSINNSTISGSKYYNLWFNDVTPVTNLSVFVQNSNLSGSQSGVAVAFDMQPTGGTANAKIDLGGGPLGSRGGNCIYGGLIYNLEATNYNVFAERDWWGSPSGPLAGSVHETNPGFTINDNYPLTSPPRGCS